MVDFKYLLFVNCFYLRYDSLINELLASITFNSGSFDYRYCQYLILISLSFLGRLFILVTVTVNKKLSATGHLHFRQ